MNGSLICPYPRINALILDKGERREEKTEGMGGEENQSNWHRYNRYLSNWMYQLWFFSLDNIKIILYFGGIVKYDLSKAGTQEIYLFL